MEYMKQCCTSKNIQAIPNYLISMIAVSFQPVNICDRLIGCLKPTNTKYHTSKDQSTCKNITKLHKTTVVKLPLVKVEYKQTYT